MCPRTKRRCWSGGKKRAPGAALLGYSYNTDSQFSQREDDDRLQMLKTLADRCGVPLLWIGKSRFSSGVLELGQVVEDETGKTHLDGGWVELADAPQKFQEYFSTSYEEMGTAKRKNKRTAGGFHNWSRDNLPKDFKKQDIDIVVTADGSDPRYIIELKRSYIALDEWTPWKDDVRNYDLQVQTALRSGSLPLIVYQNKESISDDSLCTLFQIQDLAPDSGDWITTQRQSKIKAVELRRRLIAGELGL